MVFFYTPRGADVSGHTIYVGEGKVENEELIRWGLPHDVWFHVDALSSAHVYLRLARGQTIADIAKEARGPSRATALAHGRSPGRRAARKSLSCRLLLTRVPQELEDCCQLVKANSIQGHKASNVAIVYTPWANLRKGNECVEGFEPAHNALADFRVSMAVGQVGFHDEKTVLKSSASRNAEVLNRLVKTRVERFPNLSAEREAFEAAVRQERKEADRTRRKEELETERERARLADKRSYRSSWIQDTDKMLTNTEMAAKFSSVEEAEDSFM